MCIACEVVRINGMLCHETGCPEAWKDYARECAWCGADYRPTYREQDCCSTECAEAYYGLPEGSVDPADYAA